MGNPKEKTFTFYITLENDENGQSFRSLYQAEKLCKNIIAKSGTPVHLRTINHRPGMRAEILAELTEAE